MFLKKLKLVTFVLLTGVCLCAETAVFTTTSWAAQEPGKQVEPAPQKGQPEQRKGTDKIQALLKERRDVLKKAIANMEEGFRSGQEFSLSRMQNVQSMLTKAELELCKTDKERIKVLEDAVAFASKLEKITTAGVEAGITMQVDLSLARADRLEAEIVLEREKARIASRPR